MTPLLSPSIDQINGHTIIKQATSQYYPPNQPFQARRKATLACPLRSLGPFLDIQYLSPLICFRLLGHRKAVMDVPLAEDREFAMLDPSQVNTLNAVERMGATLSLFGIILIFITFAIFR